MSRQCDHWVFERYIEATPRRKGYRRIIAICSGCAAVATRMWLTPLGDNLGWIWPEQEKAYRTWKRRLRAHGWRS